jgi:hypothetical protein
MEVHHYCSQPFNSVLGLQEAREGIEKLEDKIQVSKALARPEIDCPNVNPESLEQEVAEDQVNSSGRCVVCWTG